LSYTSKSLLLLLLLLLNSIFVDLIPVQRVDWSSFFPQTKSETVDENWFEASSQYLFIELDKPEIVDEWLENSQILNYYSLDESKHLYLLIFDRSQQSELLHEIEPYASSGTSIIGFEIMKNFLDEVSFYALYIVPFILLILFLLTSLHYWLNMILEIGTYHLLLVAIIFVSGYGVNAASLLALIFLIIYAFTLFNYLHSGEIKRSNLAFGIVISVLTTALSSLFLFYSKFGLISSFGSMMLIGLAVLLVYSLLRLYLLKNFHFPFYFADNIFLKSTIVVKSLLIFFFIILVTALLNRENLTIDLNPVNLIDKKSQTIAEIRDFENKYVDSLPFVISVELKKGDYTSLQNILELDAIIGKVESVVMQESLSNSSMAYELFAEHEFSKITKESYAQFMLALEMMNSNMPIFSADNKQSYITMLIPLESSSGTITTVVEHLEGLQKSHPNVVIKVMGKIADLGSFSTIFLKEFFTGLCVSIGFIFIFFLFYCKSYRAFGVIVATLFSLTTLLSIHAIFSIEVTIMTLLSVVLFAGLITDSIVHIFICYKESGGKCFKSVTKPIILSNVSMLVGLVGMLFSGSLMHRFGFELSILIVANLFFIVYLLPYQLNKKQ